MSVRPPLAGIQSALQHSKARGAELAKQAATARVEEEDAERAKREQVRELMERRNQPAPDPARCFDCLVDPAPAAQ